MRTDFFLRAAARTLGLVLAAGLCQGAGAAGAATVDADWRAWSHSVLDRVYADPVALAQSSSRRYEQAVQAGDLKARVRALVEQQSANTVEGADDEALAQRVTATLDAARANGRPELVFDAIDARIWNLASSLQMDKLGPLLDEQEAVGRSLGDPARLAASLANRAFVVSMGGDLGEGLRINQQALALAVDDLRRGDILLAMAENAEWAMTDTRARQTRMEWAQRALELLDPDRHPYAGIHALHIIGKLVQRDDVAKALVPRRRALELALRVRSPSTVAIMRVALAQNLVTLGRSDEAVAEAVKALPDLESPDFQRAAYGVRALGAAQKGDGAQAMAWLSRAEQLVQGSLQGWSRAREDLELLRGQVFAQLGQWQEAYASLERTRALTDQGLRAAAARQSQLLEARYDAQLKAQENTLLRASQAALEERRRYLTAALAFAALAVAGFGILAWRQTQHRRVLARLGAEAEARNAELQQVHASRTRLLAAACHDLRQPAHALGLLAELAAEVPDSRERAAKLEGIRRCSRSLTDMLGMLMDLTRLEVGSFTPHPRPVSLDELLRETEVQFAALAAQKGLHLDVQPCTLWVRSDRHLLRRILFNLVANAVRYTKQGLVTVAVRPLASGTLVLEVRDTGPGIPPERMDDVFAEFVRLDSKVEGGLGIGLPIVQRAAALLSHPLQVHSEVGVGSCFGLELPPSEPGSVAMPTVAPALASGTPRRVLLLDDDHESLSASAGLLRKWGFEVLEARDAAQAQALAREAGTLPDLFITDLHIEGGMDGLHAVEALRQAWPGLRALLVTGDLDAKVVSRAAALGVPVGYKPLSPGRLLARIEDALAQPVEPAAPDPQGSASMPLR